MVPASCSTCGQPVPAAAAYCPHCGAQTQHAPAEPEFRAYRRRVLLYSFIVCALGLPIGLALKLPVVWGLSILGLIVTPVRLGWFRRG